MPADNQTPFRDNGSSHDAPAQSARQQWNWHPDLPIGNNPLFEWPWHMPTIWAYHRDTWLKLSEVSFVLILAIATFYLMQPVMPVDGDSGSMTWVGVLYGVNLGLVCAVAGGLHWFLYIHKGQGIERKYISAFGHKGGGRFSFGNQVHDNIFWTLVSGVGFWTFYQAIMLWRLNSGAASAIEWGDSPVLFSLIIFLTGPWIAFHFYWGHRFLHMGVVYKWVHALHHRNVNVGPWSGISMHPVEHAIYFSSVFIHLFIPSHPIHICFHMYMLGLSAIIGHSGFHSLFIGNKDRFALGHFHHQLHHRYFECNYGSVDFPLDRWFGTFHDGSQESFSRLKNNLKI
ncbi:sterol desaturase family protein [Candidatus Puniceispirillum marinum]|uniref:Sterol desaturase n=1 Tax=Puniceispirillum marinum (strain IMCC1322) TaxID=488538 RepID=D5BR02_PUNMI|nr:sterol desaturase family protein [Candidatus Puniceispirillum marinum]ADE38716.1 Sterol desaturase [Candidatus Puniceispirillum marinum IMCC1322]